jgi:hypothetical protein
VGRAHASNDWTHPYDPDAKITKIRAARTHLADKAEHAVDLETGAVVSLTVQDADAGDTTTSRQLIGVGTPRGFRAGSLRRFALFLRFFVFSRRAWTSLVSRTTCSGCPYVSMSMSDVPPAVGGKLL